MIVAAAVKWNDLIFTVPKPGRHHHILHAMDAIGIHPQEVARSEQGFLTDSGKFMGRVSALAMALDAKQLIKPATHPTELFSEDLW